MARSRGKTKHTGDSPSGNHRLSGRLRAPNALMVKRPSDFSSSFTHKLKANNSSLAKTLADANTRIERLRERIKSAESSYTELLMQKNSDEARYKESSRRMSGYVVKSMTQIRAAVDTLIEMEAELRAMRPEHNSVCRLPSEPSQQRAPGSTQTLSVGPMVQGHSIRQPKISLSRINPPLRDGGCVPAVPVPAVPASEDARASPARRRTTAVTLGNLEGTGTVTGSEPSTETINAFYERVRRENPLEGSSSGKPSRPFRPLLLDARSSFDDDDDDSDFEPITSLCDRTSYSPTTMDMTCDSRRLSTIEQESSPSLFPSETDTPERSRLDTDDAISISPIEPVFHGFEAEAADRSREELDSPRWKILCDAEPEAAEPIPVPSPVIRIRIAPRKNLKNKTKATTEPSDDERKAEDPKAKPRGSSVKLEVERNPIETGECGKLKATTESSVPETPLLTPSVATNSSDLEGATSVPDQEENRTKPSGSSERTRRRVATNLTFFDQSGCADGEDAKSAPNPSTKLPRGSKLDPDWTPLSEPGRFKPREKKRPLVKRRVKGDDAVETAGDVSALRHPRVLVDRMNPGDIAEALSRSSLRIGEPSPSEGLPEKKARRRGVPANYKEPSLSKKLRRS